MGERSKDAMREARNMSRAGGNRVAAQLYGCLDKVRRERGMTQKELARRMGIRQQHVSVLLDPDGAKGVMAGNLSTFAGMANVLEVEIVLVDTVTDRVLP